MHVKLVMSSYTGGTTVQRLLQNIILESEPATRMGWPVGSKTESHNEREACTAVPTTNERVTGSKPANIVIPLYCYCHMPDLING